ncbi:acyltransferase [bacterium]|nr:acyltransferase [bacterium]
MNRQRLEYIDFAKGFAILSIVIFHYCQPYASGIWAKAIMLGGTGVHLFLFLSGFGLGLSSQTVEVCSFYKKRFAKILLPYYLTVITLYLLNPFYLFYEGNSIYALGGHLLLYKMFDEEIITSFGYHFWFISTIVQFYIVFPSIVGLKKKSELRCFIAASLFISLVYWIVVNIFSLSDRRVFTSFFFYYLWEFCLGVAAADLYANKGVEFWKKNIIFFAFLSVLGISVMGVMAVRGGQMGQIFNDIPGFTGYLSLSILVYFICGNVHSFVKEIVLFVGSLSYELYLIHGLVFELVNNFLRRGIGVDINIISSLFFVLPVSIFAAYFFMKVNQFIHKKLAPKLT